ncbi:hypothetical protein E4L96_02945, partial [Massilia arenosa]
STPPLRHVTEAATFDAAVHRTAGAAASAPAVAPAPPASEPAGRVEFWSAGLPAIPSSEPAEAAPRQIVSADVLPGGDVNANASASSSASMTSTAAVPATYAERMRARLALANRFSAEWARENSFPALCLRTAAWCWLALYVGGVAWRAVRIVQARAALRTLMAAASPSTDGVLEVDAPISPMLAGLRHPVILVPAHLRSFTPTQQALIIEHERTHLRRRDPWLRAMRLAMDAICWFNPAMRALGARLDWAQELGCDAEVLAQRTPAERKSYAAALVAQLKLQAQAPHSLALAFGSDASSMAQRIAAMRTGLPQHGRTALPFVLTGVAILAAAGVLLQPALASQAPVAATPAKPNALRAASQTSPQAIAWSAPLDRMRISSFYGAPSALRGHPHGGIDIAASRGTPIHAPADGIVDTVTDRWQGQAKYGKVIILRHDDDMQTLYAHLDKQLVRRGARVAKGDIIGYTGATGRATGPHLHFEVWDRGAQVDPETVLGSLTANATANALKGRATR